MKSANEIFMFTSCGIFPLSLFSAILYFPPPREKLVSRASSSSLVSRQEHHQDLSSEI